MKTMQQTWSFGKRIKKIIIFIGKLFIINN